jgi:hypothetical protein
MVQVVRSDMGDATPLAPHDGIYQFKLPHPGLPAHRARLTITVDGKEQKIHPVINYKGPRPQN